MHPMFHATRTLSIIEVRIRGGFVKVVDVIASRGLKMAGNLRRGPLVARSFPSISYGRVMALRISSIGTVAKVLA